jgi:hypothetical protein
MLAAERILRERPLAFCSSRILSVRYIILQLNSRMLADAQVQNVR